MAINQILYFVAYAALGLVVALVLPQAAAVPSAIAYLTGAAVFLALTLFHEMVARGRAERRLRQTLDEMASRHATETAALRELNRGLLDDVAAARQEMADLCDVVEGATEEANQALLQEMRTLQFQLGQASENWGDDRDPHQRLEALAEDLQGAEKLPRPLPPPVPSNLSDPDILDLIQEALEENRVDLYLQPVVTLPQRKTRYYEAYSRIRTADGEVMMPEAYVAVAERKGLMEVIDNLLLFRCVQLVRRLRTRQLDRRFFVNISDFTLNDPRFLGQFIDFMVTNKKLAANLIFEFDHATFLGQSEEVSGQLRRLAGLGFSFSLDRVRSVNLNFDDLAGRNVRFVKIPAPVLLAAIGDPAVTIHPGDLKELAGRAEVDIICDHIESEKQVVEILEFDVDYGQGYLFGAPRPLREGL